MKKHRFIFFVISCFVVIFVFVIPLIINYAFKQDAPFEWLHTKWNANDALSFYGTILSSIISIIGVFFSIGYAQHNYHVDELNRVKPYFALTHYQSRSKISFASKSSLCKDEIDKNEKFQSSYEEFILKKIYIIITPSKIEFKDKLSEDQQDLLLYNGFKWYNCGNGNYKLKDSGLVSTPFDVENVGNGAATNTWIAFYKKGEKPRGVRLYTIKQGHSFYFHVFCDNADGVVESEYVIELLYGDIIGNYYSQKYSVRFTRDAETGRFCTTIDLTGKQEIDERNMKEPQDGNDETGNP